MIYFISRILIVIGGLNWGAIGFGIVFGNKDWNIAHIVLGNLPMIESVFYILIGLAALRVLLPR
ncbi:MAG: hypothetical protein QG653_234 [Patescibacteria group bacterium]|nr:hypothetical protein [Patescibacteria group bacterium]